MLIRFIRNVLIEAFSGEGGPQPKRLRPSTKLQQHDRASKAMVAYLIRMERRNQLRASLRAL